MGNGRAVRRFFGGTLRIDMNPLLIAGHPCKIIDALLVNLQPWTNVNFPTCKLSVFFNQSRCR